MEGGQGNELGTANTSIQVLPALERVAHEMDTMIEVLGVEQGGEQPAPGPSSERAAASDDTQDAGGGPEDRPSGSGFSPPPRPPPPASGSGRSHHQRHRSRRRCRLPVRMPDPTSGGAIPVRGESYCDCPEQTQSRDLFCRCGEEDTMFEWTWDRDAKSAACDLTEDGREVKFHANYSSGTAAVRSTESMKGRQYFWEVKMTTPVYGTDMMVGLGTGNVDLNAFRYNFCSLLGRDGESWGLSYYGLSQQKGDFQAVSNSRFGQGSIIGVHVDMWHGTVAFYKNRRPLGKVFRGLNGKVLYPMLSSTAARTGMRLIKACSFPTSLQFLCCQALRGLVPASLDVSEALPLPPGLQAFLTNNLSWLLRPNELQEATAAADKHPSSRKRRKASPASSISSASSSPSDSDDSGSESTSRSKRPRTSRDTHAAEEVDLQNLPVT